MLIKTDLRTVFCPPNQCPYETQNANISKSISILFIQVIRLREDFVTATTAKNQPLRLPLGSPVILFERHPSKPFSPSGSPPLTPTSNF